MSNNIAILDTLLGDNGKGRASHWFSSSNKYRWSVRYASGNNAGHQIHRNGKKYSHHLLPCANYNYDVKSFLASGMMINLEALLEEISEFEKDYPNVGKSIYLDKDAFIVSKEHIEIDKEKNKHLQTTWKGMGPATVDKYARTGTRIYNLINDNAEIIKSLKRKGVNFTTILELREDFEKSNIIFEGAQGSMLDINSGIYPFVTSADTTVAAIYSAGFNFVKLDRVYGMLKPYLTKSGGGPLPTEMSDEDAKYWQDFASEFGVSTGRRRRIAYLDLPMLKYGVLKGGITHLFITKMDILNAQKAIKVCNSYGKNVYSPSDFNEVKPTYTHLQGWDDGKDIRQISPFIRYIEDYVGVPVEYISAGVNDDDVIKLK